MFKLKNIALLIGSTIAFTGYASASNDAGGFYFPASALTNGNESDADLSVFFNDTGLAPGNYDVQVNLNNKAVSRFHNINFILCGNKLCPLFKYDDLISWGVKIEVPNEDKKSPDVLISDIIPFSTTSFDADKLVLNITIPMTYVGDLQLDTSNWNDGVTMVFSSYDASYTKSQYKSAKDYDSQYLNLVNGANLGPWRLRNTSYYNKYGSSKGKWDSVETYIERNLKSLKANLIAGKFSSSGLILDGYQFKGLGVSSDDDMLMDNQQGFAPVVRGQALTNARVVIKQNGVAIYDRTVTPGPFEIKDLNPTSSSGDLEVEVIEENGSVKRFTQAFSAAPLMIRKNTLKFNFNIGKYDNSSSEAKKENFASGEIIYGLLSDTTIYGGLVHSPSYTGGKVGLGQGLGFLGAVSLDYSLSKSQQHNNNKRGRAIEAKYSKSLIQTGTTFTLAGYKYSSKGYSTFSDALGQYYYDYADSYNPKEVFQLSINQSLNDYGSLNISAYEQRYWRGSSKTRTVTGGYSTSIGGVSINANIANNRYKGSSDKIYSLSMSIPLDILFGKKMTSQRLLYSYSEGGKDTYSRTSLSGSLLKDNNLYYTLSQSTSTNGDSYSLNATYTGSKGTMNAGYSYDNRQNKRTNIGLSGSVGVFGDGLFLGQKLSNTGANAIVVARGAENIKVMNKTSIYTDASGFAVVPNLGSYRDNNITIDTSNLPDNIDITNNTKRITPTRGAFIKVDYLVKKGNKLYATFLKDGIPLPLGTVIDKGKITESIVGQNGEAFISAYEDGNSFTAVYNRTHLICEIEDKFKQASEKGIMVSNVMCR
ncbi:fimbrial biogenesis outer membrane usher protein [Enterobacter quasihormaechei]|uniref:fimbria/pilus outer membrane usher protein n=1 Tax=Enterobacter quasihormaechei TaxID=2529382 RepID=UPI002F429AFE